MNGDQKVKAPARVTTDLRPDGTARRDRRRAGSERQLRDRGPTSQPRFRTTRRTSASATPRRRPESKPPPQESNPGYPSVEESKEAFQKYAECLDKTKPDDAKGRVRCAELLR